MHVHAFRESRSLLSFEVTPRARSPRASRALRVLCLTGVFAVLATVFAAGQSRASTSPEYYGLNTQTLFRLEAVSPDRWGSFLDQMQAGGMTRGRIDANWQYAEPAPPAASGQHNYTWFRSWDPRSSMDTQARLMASRGIRMVPVLSHAPDWAAGSGTKLTPARYADFAAFAAAFAKRYGPGGDFWRENPDLPALPVHEYELWTEANSPIFWTGSANPAEYDAALRAIRPALKRVDPSAQLLASIGWMDWENYVRQMYANGAKGLIDGIGFHPYAPNAPSILALVTRMRGILNGVGDGGLPIWITETGQPASTGAGGDKADSGLVADVARAATQTMTGDALARSDCDIRDFQVYAIVGTETNREPLSEGFMGVMRLSNATPNATGAALMRASLRWRARQDSGIVLCGSGTTPPDKLLPLDLQIEHFSPTCVRGITTYDGNPMEAAMTHLTTADGRDAPGYVNAYGQSEVCIPNGPPIWEFDVVSRIDNVATSQRWRCTVPVSQTVPPGSCRIVDTPLPAASPTPSKAKAKPTCRWQVSAKLLSARPKNALLRSEVGCKVTPKKANFGLSLRAKGKTTKNLKPVTLVPGVTKTISLPRRLKKGESVELATKGDKTRKLPKLVARTAALGGATAAGSEGCDWKLETKVLGKRKLRARLTCPPPRASLRFTLAVQRKKAKKAKTLRTLTLRGGRVTKINVRTRLRVGDVVILARAADAKLGVPQLRALATTRKHVVRAR